MKFKQLKILLILLLSLFIVSPNLTLASESFFYPGEDLLYEVSYLGIKIGSIRVLSEGIQNVNGKQVCKAKAYVDSYNGIPFVNLHTIFNTWMDMSFSHSLRFASNFFEDEVWKYEEINFDYDNKKAIRKVWQDKKQVLETQIKADRKMVDGLNLLFFPRKYLRLNKSVKVSTYVYDVVESTFLNFVGKKENVKIDAVDYPIKTIYFNGNAEYKGFYGLSGKFEGWFSDDEASIPIKANLKVILGSVDVELIKWKRGTWRPPSDAN